MKPTITPDTCDTEYFIYQSEKSKGRTNAELAQALSAFKKGKHLDRYGLRDVLGVEDAQFVLRQGGVVYEVYTINIFKESFLIHHHLDESGNPTQKISTSFSNRFKTLKLSNENLYKQLGEHFFNLYDARIQKAFEETYGTNISYSGYSQNTVSDNKHNIGNNILHQYYFNEGPFIAPLESVVKDIRNEFEIIIVKSYPKYVLGYSSISMEE